MTDLILVFFENFKTSMTFYAFIGHFLRSSDNKNITKSEKPTKKR